MTSIYIIAGEASGDFIGSLLMKNLKKTIHHCSFSGIGGPLMQKEGLDSLFNVAEISLMGFVEILPHVFNLQKLIKNTVANIILVQPAIIITIDAPGFTYRVASKIKSKIDCKLVHIVAPSVWAYKPNRVFKYAKIYDHLLALLPFEPPMFTKVGLKCSYIGHPVLEQHFYADKNYLKKEANIEPNEKVICVTAGSRKGEIIRHLPIFKLTFANIANKYSKLKIIFVVNNNEHENMIRSYLIDSQYNIEFSYDRLKAFALADIAIAKSGTNVLEIAASSTPMVVIYKLNSITYLILRRLIKIPYVSLVNIVLNRLVIPEFLQHNCSPSKIAATVIDLLESKTKQILQVKLAQEALSILGYRSELQPSEKAALIISELLK
ncbi:MAG: lipid-A-disaccharide synthase [Rickettsiaceae bacterium]|nr:MAG: lipid-A-disaccharide synthase [Rickettsiaceae bacterium]